MTNDRDIGKREIEREHLGHFLWSYERVTGDNLAIIAETETPDFLAKDADGRTVGIELTQIRFSPQERVT
jgi:hypothetical protein